MEEKEDRQAESLHLLKDEGHLKVQEAHQEGPGEPAGQQRVAEEEASPAVPQQQPLEDQQNPLQEEEPAGNRVSGGAQEAVRAGEPRELPQPQVKGQKRA